MIVTLRHYEAKMGEKFNSWCNFLKVLRQRKGQ